jgi:hypothetical protein
MDFEDQTYNSLWTLALLAGLTIFYVAWIRLRPASA